MNNNSRRVTKDSKPKWQFIRTTAVFLDPRNHPHRLFIFMLILLAFGMRIPLLMVRYFDPDEFEHIHAAYSIYHGQLPYRDFFEHHTPMLHYILAFLYPVFGESIALIFAARVLMWLSTGFILILVFFLGRLSFNEDVGLLASFLLSYMIMFLEKSLEVRPDHGAVVCLLLSLILLIIGARNQSKRAYMWAGICMSFGLLFTPKILFAMAAVALVFIYQLIVFRISLKRHIKQLLFFPFGFLIPFGANLIFFAVQGGADDFIYRNFLMNLGWKVRFAPWGYIKQALTQNILFVMLGIVGMSVAASKLHRRQSAVMADHVLFLTCLALFGFLFVMPVPYRQYYMMFIPLWAIFGASVLWELAQIDLPRLWRERKTTLIVWSSVIILYLLALFYLIGIRNWIKLNPTFLNSAMMFRVVWTLAALVLISLVIFVKPGKLRNAVVLSVVCLAMTGYPLDQMRAQLKNRNDAQLDEIRYVMQITKPNETVMDGWTGRGVFRPHPYYYWFLHGEVRAMLTEKEKTTDIINALERTKTPVIIYDGNVQAMSKPLNDYIKSNYVHSGKGQIFVRKDR